VRWGYNGLIKGWSLDELSRVELFTSLILRAQHAKSNTTPKSRSKNLSMRLLFNVADYAICNSPPITARRTGESQTVDDGEKGGNDLPVNISKERPLPPSDRSS